MIHSNDISNLIYILPCFTIEVHHTRGNFMLETKEKSAVRLANSGID